MPNKHRRSEDIFIEGEGFVVPNPKRVFRFCRMFSDLPKRQHDEADLTTLGRAMQDTVLSTKTDTGIPSGYTYLMQFVDHDLVFDWTRVIPYDLKAMKWSALIMAPATPADDVPGRST